MSPRIDDEPVATGGIFIDGNEVTVRLRRVPATANRGDRLDRARISIRPHSGDHDPVKGMVAFEPLTVADEGFRRGQQAPMDSFPGIGFPIPQRPLGLRLLPVGEEIGIANGNPCPISVLFIPPALDPQGRKQAGVARGRA